MKHSFGKLRNRRTFRTFNLQWTKINISGRKITLKKIFFFEKNRKNIFLENYFHTFKKSKWGIFLADLVDNHVF